MESILIIESSYMMRLFLINYLDKNFDVIAVESPTEALDLLEKRVRPDAVISNFYGAKNLERKAFLELISDLEGKSIPLVVLTDQDKSDQRIETLKLGAKDSISKPFNPVELQLRILSAMGMKGRDKMRRVA